MIDLLSIPPQDTKKNTRYLINGSTKKYVRDEISSWLKNNSRPLIQYDITELFELAYKRIQYGETAVSVFSATALYPVNKNALKDHNFIGMDNEQEWMN